MVVSGFPLQISVYAELRPKKETFSAGTRCKETRQYGAAAEGMLGRNRSSKYPLDKVAPEKYWYKDGENADRS